MWPWRPHNGGHAPGVMRAMATHGLQLVLWTPWPQALQHTSRRRYCVNGVGYRSHLHMWDHRTRARRSARCPPRAPSGHHIRPIRTQPHEMCVQLLPTMPQYTTGWYASQWQAIGQLYTRTNHHHGGAWARWAHEGPCGGYVGLASKPKLQGR